MILADYGSDFRALSLRHEALIKRAADLLDAYQRGEAQHPTYAVIGTFGAGKTQFLYHLARQALERGLIPLLFLAEDVFSEVIRTEAVFTQGDVATLVERKATEAVEALSHGGKSEEELRESFRTVLDPRGHGNRVVDALAEHFAGRRVENPKVLLLIDELEGLYGILQRRVLTDKDRSPLREFFQSRLLFGITYLKFCALAPAGIYELGGADQTRVLRLVIPAADVDYIRSNLISEPGRANSAWWLSRGKARHLFKACLALKDAPAEPTAPQVSRIIREELDQIGQAPTEVPPAVTDGLPPSKLPSLLNLAPVPITPRRCYHIDLSSLDEGRMAECLTEALGLNTDASLLLAEYFKTTTLGLSDGNRQAFIPDNELADLLALSLDHLLEYEYGNPTLVKHMGDMLALYERFKSDAGAVYGIIAHRLWENKQSDRVLPLSIAELRRVFPFPLMNPIVRRHNPTEMKGKWEGKGLPLWRWSTDGTTCWFFASSRDYAQFLDTDEFVSMALPDGASVLCLFPPDDVPRTDTGLALWCRQNGKLNTEQLPQLLADFLFSGTGDLSGSTPGDLRALLKVWVEDKTDVLLSRKAQIYQDALAEIVRGALPQPKLFCKDSPPDAENVWGGSQVSDRAVAVTSLSIAWAEFDAAQKASLAQLRDLFRSGKDGRGAGDLNKLKPRGGVIGMADDLLPRYGRAKTLTDSQVVQRVRDYWPDNDRTQLVGLAHQLPLERFLKLCPDENRQRFLESLWRSVRGQFGFGDRARTLEEYVRWLESEILPVLESATELEAKAKDSLGVTGIEFEDEESFVKAAGGFRSLRDMMKTCLDAAEGAAAQTAKALLELFASSLDVAKSVRSLQTRCESARRALERVDRTADALLRNVWEYPKAVSLLETSEDEIKEFLAQERNVPETCTLADLSQKAADKAERFEEINQALKRLEDRLGDIAVSLGVKAESEVQS
ncbi:MAG: ATP-binding protein [Planctomycetota bacterium]|nr:ATP-binding protein [Planctomycetota bacterium]